MNDEQVSAEQVAAITAYVDVEAPPPGPSAHIIFGTNQAIPAAITADRYHQGLAPLIIATGGVNRHNGIVEGREFRRMLLERGVPEQAIRYEDRSANTWQNVEFALPYLQEALASGLPITAVCKWYHRRAIHTIKTLLPSVDGFFAITWEPLYSGTPVSRSNWFLNPGGKRRVLREYEEVPRRVADGSFVDVNVMHGAWR